jgi:hypothetical protein
MLNGRCISFPQPMGKEVASTWACGLNKLAADSDFRKRAQENPTAEGLKVRKAIRKALHLGEVAVPFSTSEMDSAFIKMNVMLQWRGAPLVFLTFSP